MNSQERIAGSDFLFLKNPPSLAHTIPLEETYPFEHNTVILSCVLVDG